MKIACVSGSNVITAKDQSASKKVCKIIKECIGNSHQLELVDMLSKNLTPCNMCQSCAEDGLCQYDEDFNSIMKSLSEADACLFIVPHYALIPSKIVMLLEKIQEIMYLSWCRDNTFQHPLNGKPVGIIAHGGQIEGFEDIYTQNILQPLSNALKSCSFRVIGYSDERPYGIIFGVKGYKEDPKRASLMMEHDWDKINDQVKDYITVFLDKLS